MSDTKPDLKTAYSLNSPQDSIDLYRSWAKTYDDDFAKANDYQNPARVAGLFAAHGPENTPILDVGAGTGLVGEALATHNLDPVDALDISGEMLEMAMSKGCYRAAIKADLSFPIDIADETYGGVTSAGTFTHGHVGPAALDELIRVARSGALFVLAINGEIYRSAGFADKFAALSGVISDFRIVETQGYGASASADLQKKRSAVAVFRKR